MTITLICQYCDRAMAQAEPYCPSCGAPISAVKTAGGAQPDARPNPETIRQICSQFEDVDCCYLDETIPDKKQKNAIAAFGIPTAEKIIMLCDATVFGSAKVGFAICEAGLYWKNDWTTPTKRTYLSWADFGQRSLSIDDYALDLQRGDQIDLAGVGDDDIMQRILAMLRQVQKQFSPA